MAFDEIRGTRGMTQKILLVDDEPNVLQGFKRHLRNNFDFEIAVGGHEAIELFKSSGPFAVVVSDMQMPKMSGIELLSKIRDLNEHTVRIMLTGNADQKTAVDAVNEGNIFRFLNKPCTPEHLEQVLNAALEQYRLVTAEAELLSQTLAGSVRMLTQVLSLAMPQAFGLTQEARTLVRTIAERLNTGPLWQLEMAAMLMRVGCVSLPDDVLSRYLEFRPLSVEDAKLVAQTPTIGKNLVSAIPRLQGVAAIIAAQSDPPLPSTPLAARILRVVGDFQRMRSQSSPYQALKRLRNESIYDLTVVDALTEIITETCEIREVSILELREGMILEDSIEDRSGRLLLANGTEVHEAMIQKLLVLRRSSAGVREPIHVRIATVNSNPVLATHSV
jgi:response regulator RpfG family c-di-GMP phosphodiesterase